MNTRIFLQKGLDSQITDLPLGGFRRSRTRRSSRNTLSAADTNAASDPVNPDTIFFDLDGTLTDPKPGITRSIQYALHKLEQSTIPTEDQLTWCIGPPLRASFVKLLGGEASADLAVSLYRERFSDVGLYENSLYAGIRDVLSTLRNTGHRLFVATSKPHVFADRIIDHFDLRHHFDHVYGYELDGSRVDKSDLLA